MGDWSDEYSGWDPEDWEDDGSRESEPFDVDCRYCHKPITMVPTDAGWRPHNRHNDKPHSCRTRATADEFGPL